MNNNIIKFIQQHEFLSASLMISLVIILSNIYIILGLDVLLLDDNARYFSMITDTYVIDDPRSFIGLGLWVKWLGVYLFSTYSAELARVFFLLFFMIPLSILYYYFNRNCLKLSLWVSLGSAALICILPRQFMIPAFLDGSGILAGTIVYICTLILLMQYLKKLNNNYLLYFLIITLWLVTLDMLAELSVALFPILVILIISQSPSWKKRLLIFTPLMILTLIRIYFYFQTAGINLSNQATLYSFYNILLRIGSSFEYWLPVLSKSIVVNVIMLSVLFVTLIWAFFLIFFKDRDKKNMNIIVFYIIWLILSSAIFWFISKYFSSRYFFIAFFALTTLFFMAVNRLIPSCIKDRPYLSYALLMLILGFSGYQRYTITKPFYERYNRVNEGILKLLKNEHIDNETQIVLANIKNGTGGYLMWSSGYLSFLLKKGPVFGLMGNEYYFYNPFDLTHCSYSFQMSCLDEKKKLIAYKKDAENYKISRMEYFLKWEKIPNKPGLEEWTLFQSEKDNQLTIIASGIGVEEYKKNLQKLNVDSKRILWGDIEKYKTAKNDNK